MDEFLFRAALGGFGLAVAAGPLGAFVVWRRMAYFGDATSHSAILGVAFALAVGAPVGAGVAVVVLAMGWLLLRLAGRGQSADTALGVLSHSALALGLLAVAFLPGPRIDLEALLFGDVLAIGWGDIAAIWAVAAAVAGLVAWRWSALLTATLHPDLARSEGIRPEREDRILILALALTVAAGLQVVGALLIAALLIIPAAAAGQVARTPERAVAVGAGIGTVSVLTGLGGSLAFDLPAGPAIAGAAAVVYAVLTALRGVSRRP